MHTTHGNLTKLFSFFDCGRNKDLYVGNGKYYVNDMDMPVYEVGREYAAYMAWFQLNRLGMLVNPTDGIDCRRVKDALIFGI